MNKAKDGIAKSDKKAPAKILMEKQGKTTKNPINNAANAEYEKSKSFIIVEIIEYVPNSVVIKTIIKKTTGNVTVSSFDTGEALTEKTSPFDTFVQVIDGKAEIFINGNSNSLNTGQSIIIPAHARNVIKANERFKIISTVIKSGYDEVS
ncbi:MAG: cupin domain-containing protein [Bacteroidales bacterium]|nr:cupin domain-containing protein [Bacteroidales bacterium]